MVSNSVGVEPTANIVLAVVKEGQSENQSRAGIEIEKVQGVSQNFLSNIAAALEGTLLWLLLLQGDHCCCYCEERLLCSYIAPLLQ